MKTPQQLYADWERAHWAAQDIDLSRDGELGAYGLNALTRRLGVIGVSLG
jgi:hypothetical protein